MRDKKLKLSLADTATRFDRDKVSSGASFSGHERDCLFLSLGGQQFKNVSGISGLDFDGDSRVSSFLDFDHDGWQDVAIASANAPLLRLCHNRIGKVSGSDPQFVALRLVGGNDTSTSREDFSNRDGVGAIIRVTLDDKTLLREVHCGEGFAGQNSRTLIIGTGRSDSGPPHKVSAIEVTWPSGRRQTLEDGPQGQLLTVYEDVQQSPTGEAFEVKPYLSPEPRDLASVQPESTDAIELPVTRDSRESKLRVYITMATWCTACKLSIPKIQALRETFGTDEVALLGVPIDPADTPEKLADYQAKWKPAYELLADVDADQAQQLVRLGIESLKADGTPMAFVIDKANRIRQVRFGTPTVSELRALLEQLVATHPNPNSL